MGAFLRRYGAAATIQLPLQEVGSLDLAAGAVAVAGDVQISKDDGPLVNAASLPVESPLGSGLFVLSLSAAEMSAARVTVIIADQSVPKDFENRIVLIETFAHASAQHPYDPAAAPASVSVEMQETRQ